VLIGALLVRDEADRYLRRVLENVQSLVDKLVIVDDGSTDDTADICREYGDVTSTADETGFWQHDEAVARALLWRLAGAAAGPDGWVYVADGDHLLEGIDRAGLATLVRASLVNGWATPLLDCWDGDEQHRVDGHWQAWRTPRVWIAKAFPQEGFEARWDTEGLHVGHLPSNFPLIPGIAPAWIRHLGYCDPADRASKMERYLQRA